MEPWKPIYIPPTPIPPPNPQPPHSPLKPPSPKSYLKGGWGMGSQNHNPHIHVGFLLNNAKGLALNGEWKRTFRISLSYIIGFVSVFVFLSIDTS